MLFFRALTMTLLILIATAIFVGRSSAETTPSVSGKAEAAAMEFARTHHPELASLLEQLKTNAPSEYRSAILDIDKARERLEKSREKTPERAAIELAEWKVNSRIRLLVARMSMGGDSSLEADLKAALRERADLRVQLLTDERDRLRRRLDKLDDTIADHQRRASDQVEKEFVGLKRNATAAEAPKPVKPADAKPSEKNRSETKKPDVKKSEAKKPEKKPEQKASSESKPGKPDGKPAPDKTEKTKPEKPKSKS
ncbi:MAG TPA: hypothetical protein VFG20_16350 [Planctomycetaceae bacterium]|nr:hypothetical protein [Planctomycetaceae bacterium]